MAYLACLRSDKAEDWPNLMNSLAHLKCLAWVDPFWYFSDLLSLMLSLKGYLSYYRAAGYGLCWLAALGFLI